MLHAFPSLLFVPSVEFNSVKFKREVWEALLASRSVQRQNDSQLQKLEGTKYTWTQRSSKIGETLPKGSRRVVAPIGNENVPIQLAQCRFPGLAISSAKN